LARYHVVRLLPYPPDALFEMVGDVARYPEFIRWITSMEAQPPQETEPGVTILDAEAGVGFSFLRERFSTRVKRDAAKRQIDVSLLSGPFKRLYNRWKFLPHHDGTEVIFDIDFEFRSRMLDLMLKANFATAVDKLIGSFEDRAKVLYGGAAVPHPPAAGRHPPREGEG
jgi:coenzyme Q-binding protein COQ10